MKWEALGELYGSDDEPCENFPPDEALVMLYAPGMGPPDGYEFARRWGRKWEFEAPDDGHIHITKATFTHWMLMPDGHVTDLLLWLSLVNTERFGVDSCDVCAKQERYRAATRQPTCHGSLDRWCDEHGNPEAEEYSEDIPWAPLIRRAQALLPAPPAATGAVLNVGADVPSGLAEDFQKAFSHMLGAPVPVKRLPRV